MAQMIASHYVMDEQIGSGGMGTGQNA